MVMEMALVLAILMVRAMTMGLVYQPHCSGGDGNGEGYYNGHGNADSCCVGDDDGVMRGKL